MNGLTTQAGMIVAPGGGGGGASWSTALKTDLVEVFEFGSLSITGLHRGDVIDATATGWSIVSAPAGFAGAVNESPAVRLESQLEADFKSPGYPWTIAAVIAWDSHIGNLTNGGNGIAPAYVSGTHVTSGAKLGNGSVVGKTVLKGDFTSVVLTLSSTTVGTLFVDGVEVSITIGGSPTSELWNRFGWNSANANVAQIAVAQRAWALADAAEHYNGGSFLPYT